VHVNSGKQLWKIMCVRREEGKKNIFFQHEVKNGTRVRARARMCVCAHARVCARACVRARACGQARMHAGGCKSSKSCRVPCGTLSAWTTGKGKR